MNGRSYLTQSQLDLMVQFYDRPLTKAVFSHNERKKLWLEFKTDRKIPKIDLREFCPALLNELERSLDSGNLLQSAVFSECAYAQTIANMFQLENFKIFNHEPDCLNSEILALVESHGLRPRYVYRSSSNCQILVQAGGPNGVDGALIDSEQLRLTSIEFKEPAAKTSEPDLPKYGEDGMLRVTTDFLFKYPQFEPMLDEQLRQRLNILDRAGGNINNFSDDSITYAITENYASTKFADVICTEDKSSFLTMLPANQISIWAEMKGEIRPAGRNKYEVWTPNALQRIIESLEGSINGSRISVPANKLTAASARGGNGTVNRYKLHPIFFVYSKDVTIVNGIAEFNISEIRQLNPTVSAHMFFKDLDAAEVKNHYFSRSSRG